MGKFRNNSINLNFSERKIDERRKNNIYYLKSKSNKTFFKFKSKIEIKDLGRYPSIQDLWEVTDAFSGETETLSKSQMEKVIKKDTKKLIDTPDFKVYVPETKESACYYGKGTKWCTAADKDNMFDNYNSIYWNVFI